MSKPRTITLTESEATAADGNLCWKHPHNGPFRYGLACSREWGHDGLNSILVPRSGVPVPVTECRYDMRIKVPTWTSQRIRLAAVTAALSFAVTLLVGLVVPLVVTRWRPMTLTNATAPTDD